MKRVASAEGSCFLESSICKFIFYKINQCHTIFSQICFFADKSNSMHSWLIDWLLINFKWEVFQLDSGSEQVQYYIKPTKCK